MFEEQLPRGRSRVSELRSGRSWGQRGLRPDGVGPPAGEAAPRERWSHCPERKRADGAQLLTAPLAVFGVRAGGGHGGDPVALRLVETASGGRIPHRF